MIFVNKNLKKPFYADLVGAIKCVYWHDLYLTNNLSI